MTHVIKTIPPIKLEDDPQRDFSALFCIVCRLEEDMFTTDCVGVAFNQPIFNLINHGFDFKDGKWIPPLDLSQEPESPEKQYLADLFKELLDAFSVSLS